MNIKKALILVRDKYLDEQKGISNSDISKKYQTACAKYPATMKLAHIIFALEINGTR